MPDISYILLFNREIDFLLQKKDTDILAKKDSSLPVEIRDELQVANLLMKTGFIVNFAHKKRLKEKLLLKHREKQQVDDKKCLKSKGKHFCQIEDELSEEHLDMATAGFAGVDRQSGCQACDCKVKAENIRGHYCSRCGHPASSHI